MNYTKISLLLFIFCIFNFSKVAAQCQNCTTLISSNQNNLTVSSGVVCIAPGVTITGTISLSNGATLCNQGTLNISSMIVNTAQNANLINYGSISANSIMWGTNATGSFNNYGTVLCNDLNLGYHNGYNVNFTNHPNANFTVNCSAYLLAGTFNFNGPATFNAPIYFSGSASTVNVNFNAVFNCTNQINSGAGIANNITVTSNATVNAYSWNITDDALFTNNGTVNISDAFIMQASSGENIIFNQNNNLRVRGSSPSTGLSLSNVGGNLQFNNSGPTSVQNRFSIQGATLIMNGYNVFCNSLYITSSSSVSTSLNCGGRINVSGTSILQNSVFGPSVDMCDAGGGWDANQGTFNGTLCSCNGIGTVGPYVSFPSTSNCPVQCAPTGSTLNQVACSSFTLNGQTYNQSGTFTQVRTNATGCDSTITLNLTIRQPSTSTVTQTTCSSFTLNGQTYSQSGNYTQVRTNAAGCDSTITLNLTIRQPSTSTIIQSACSSFTLNGQTYNQSGTYTQVRTNTAGCDSTITLNLTISQPSSSTIIQSACSTFTLNGQTYIQTGTYTQVRNNAAGCDSTITLNLTIRQPSTSTLTQSACSSFTLNGQPYRQSGTYTQVINNAAGCDSTITLNLTIYQPSTSTLTQSACSSFTLNGQTYSQSGTYTQVTTNAAGCDSTITLNLTISQPSTSTVTQTACSSFILNGQTYSQSGTYTQVISNAAGCDSTITLNLTILPIPIITKSNDTSICAGRTVNLFASGGQSYAWSPAASLSNASIANPVASPLTNTIYVVTVTSQNGCSATGQVSVLVNSNPIVNVNSITICQGQSTTLTAIGASNYSWSPAIGLSSTVGATVIANPLKTRFYQVIGTDQNGCSGIANVTVTVVSRPYVNLGRDQVVCRGSAVLLDAGINGAIYQWNTGQTTQTINVSVTGSYAVTVSTQNGCSGIDTVNVTFKRCRNNTVTVLRGKTGDLYENPKNEENNIIVRALKIYPNPARTHITIDNGNFELMNGYTVRIYNALGQTVFTQAVNQQQFFIDLSTWTGNGLYYLNLIDNQGNSVETKVIVVQ